MRIETNEWGSLASVERLAGIRHGSMTHHIRKGAIRCIRFAETVAIYNRADAMALREQKKIELQQKLKELNAED